MKYFELLANELIDGGQRTVLKPSIAIPWNKDDIHDRLWIPVQQAVVKTGSTTELTKQQVSEIYDILNRHLSEKFGLSVQFPSHELGYWEKSHLTNEID